MTNAGGSDIAAVLHALLARLDPLLPPQREVDWTAPAFRWRRRHYLGGVVGHLEPVRRVARIAPGDLRHIDEQRAAVLRNTEQFVRGLPANNVLLTGARGTGKSSLIRACLAQFHAEGLRLPVAAAALARPAPAVLAEQAAASPGAAAADAARGMALAAAGEGPDAGGLRAYRIGLGREARAHRRYPPLARERGWTGTAEIRVEVSPGGQPWQVLLARSSGHEILDREAVLLVRNAAATTVLPDSLRGREFAVRMPVTFDIAEMQ